LFNVSSATLSTAGGTIITLAGQNFGPNTGSAAGNLARANINASLALQYGSYTALSCAANASSPSLGFVVCQGTVGVGTLLTAWLGVGNQVATVSGAFSYTRPALTAMTCWVNGVQQATMPTTGCLLNINGSNFGLPTASVPVVQLTQGAASLSVQACNISVAHSVISCLVGPGVGTAYTPTVSVALQSGIVNAALQLSFSRPQITNLTGATVMQTTGGEIVTVWGQWFGPAGTPVAVSYGSASDLANNYSVPNCSVTDHTTIVCETVAGVGQNLAWTVLVGGQSVTSTMTTSYAPPTVLNISLPSPTNTTGGAFVTVSGVNFGPPPGASIVLTYVPAWAGRPVVYNATGCSANQSQIVCTMAAGVGTDLAFTVTVGRQPVVDYPTAISYVGPVVTQIVNGPFNTQGSEPVIIAVR
jgi:hypothetical protein